MEVGGGGIIYLLLHCHHQNDSCIKMGSDESHFNVSLIVTDKATRQCPQTTTFLKRKESRSCIEPRSFRLPAYRLTARPNRHSVVCTMDLYNLYRSMVCRARQAVGITNQGLRDCRGTLHSHKALWPSCDQSVLLGAGRRCRFPSVF